MAEKRAPEVGVTLIEVLVVLTLIAVGAGVVSLALPDRASDRNVAQEAELLASRLNLAAERSLVEGQSFRISWGAQEYGFSAWGEGKWQSSRLATLPAKHVLATDAALVGQPDTEKTHVIITPDLLPPQSGALEWRVTGGATDAVVSFDGFRAEAKGGR